MTNKDDSERGITRYSSSQINRGLDLAKKVSIVTEKISSAQKISVEQVDSCKYTQDAEYFLKIAMQQITPTEYQYALANIQKAIDINPDYYEAYIIRYSMIYLPLGCYQEAIEDCNQVLRINSKNAEALTNRGWAYDKLGYHLQSLQDYDLALIIKPDFELAYMNRGLAYMHCNNFYKSIDDFQQVINTNPYNADAYSNKGLSLLYLNEYQEALNNFNKAIQINSEHVNAYLNKGLCYVHLGDELKCAENFFIGLRLNPEHAKGYFEGLNENGIESAASMLVNLGLVIQLDANCQEALELFDLAIYLNPICKEAYYARGTVKLQLLYLEEAMYDFDRVLSIDPSSADSYVCKGVIFNHQERHHDAIKNYELALRIEPHCELALLKRGISRSRLGNKQGALNDYTRVIKLNADHSLAYILRATIYYEAEYNSQATEDFIKGYILSGNQLLESGNYTEAIESYAYVLKVDPNNMNAYNGRSTARSAIGDYQGAIEDLNKVRMMN